VTASYILHKNDLPADVKFSGPLAVDCEFMGPDVWRDRLCLIQLRDEKSDAHIVQFAAGGYAAPNLKKILSDAKTEKIFHGARADMRGIGRYLGIIPENIYCLQIASRISRTYTQSHTLDDIARHLLGFRLHKDQQSINWGADELAPELLDTAAGGVMHLHAMRGMLDEMMKRDDRLGIAQGLFQCLPALVKADLGGWGEGDVFAVGEPE